MLDRALQRELLDTLRGAYPGALRCQHLVTTVGTSEEAAIANLVYLGEHDLCEPGVGFNMDGSHYFGLARITARGLDFLEDDGGLSAVLGTVVIRLHADTVRDLIGERIDAADIPAPEKSALRKHLASLPETVLREATTQLVRQGLCHLPDAIGWLRTSLGA